MNRIEIGTFDYHVDDIKIVKDALDSGQISIGEYLDLFETKMASRHFQKYGVMVNSGQSALEISIAYAKYFLGKEKLKIAIPATTYAATLWAVIKENCIPVFVDVDEHYTMDFSEIPEDCDVVIPVDLCGKACEIPDWVQERYFIIRDSCEAVGNTHVDSGDLICLSFYVSHIITTGSGGMVCTNNKEAEKWIRRYIAHGRVFGGDFSKNKNEWKDKFLFDMVGVSCRSNNILGALGYSQLKRIDSIIQARKDNAYSYMVSYAASEALRDHFIFPNMRYWETCIFQFFPIVIKPETNIDRRELLEYLFEQGVDSRVLLSLTNQPIFKNLYGDIEASFPMSKVLNEKGFLLGCHQDLNTFNIGYVIGSLMNFLFYKGQR